MSSTRTRATRTRSARTCCTASRRWASSRRSAASSCRPSRSSRPRTARRSRSRSARFPATCSCTWSSTTTPGTSSRTRRASRASSARRSRSRSRKGEVDRILHVATLEQQAAPDRRVLARGDRQGHLRPARRFRRRDHRGQRRGRPPQGGGLDLRAQRPGGPDVRPGEAARLSPRPHNRAAYPRGACGSPRRGRLTTEGSGTWPRRS